MASPIGLSRNLGQSSTNNFFSRAGIPVQVLNNHLNGHVRFIGLPAVVVRHHCECRIGDFGFTRAFSLAEVCHANDVVTGPMIGYGLGAGAESRAFHVDVCAAVVRSDLENFCAVQQDESQFFADRLGERGPGQT